MMTHPEWMTEEALHTLSKGYLLPGETPKALFERCCKAVEKRICVLYGGTAPFPVAEELFHCLWNGWLGLSSPFASNMGTSRGLPVSCYGIDVEDSISSIFSHLKESARLSQKGGGVGIYLGRVRCSGSPISGGGTSTGIVPWAKLYDETASKVNQGGVRRGSFAIYLPIEHPDLEELLLSKDHSQGDPRKHIDSNVAVTISDEWMESMLEGDEEKFNLFTRVLETRLKTGSPYLLFTDNINNQSPECYKERNLQVVSSNICTEITLYTDEDHSFVCVLMSANLAKWDEWKDWVSPSGFTVPQLAVFALEAVTEEFIQKGEREVGLGRSVRFAKKGRPIGIGTMGLHLLYQKKGFPFASSEARALNTEVHKFIHEEARKASARLAKDLGEPEWCEGHGMRHTHLTAIAPTKTNAVISGAFSEGIAPITANIYGAVQAKGSYLRKNPELERVLEEKGKNTPEVWSSITGQNGSVQHLNFLSPSEKEVFKTAREINQLELVHQAIDRQKYVDQAQSLNLFVNGDISALELLRLHVTAWEGGLKSLYYLKSQSLVVEVNKKGTAFIITQPDCPYCQKLKEALSERGVFYTEIDRSEAKVFHEEWKTVPQLWIDGEYIGGYEDFIGSTGEEKEEGCIACEA